MSSIIFYALLLLFFVAALLILNPFVSWLSDVFVKRSRTRNRTRSNIDWSKYENLKISETAKEQLDLVDIKLSPFVLLLISVVFGLAAGVLVNKYMNYGFGSLVATTLAGILPTVVVWSMIESRAQKLRMVMIPTVQTFLGFFSESETLKSAIYNSSFRIPLEMQKEWNKLVKSLDSGVPMETALLTFANRVNNQSAHDFVEVLLLHADYGVDIVPSLFKLVNEMQNSSYNEERRNTLLAAYKWGTVALVGATIVVVWVNCILLPKAIYYYFVYPGGKQLITVSTIVLFASLISALSMGRKKM